MTYTNPEFLVDLLKAKVRPELKDSLPFDQYVESVPTPINETCWGTGSLP